MSQSPIACSRSTRTPVTSSVMRDAQRGIFGILAHEVAHQWFGNLVTTAWWDNLWLNEGFASWMENKSTDHFHPEWHVWLSTQAGQQSAMRTDARAGTHPIVTPIRDVFAAANANLAALDAAKAAGHAPGTGEPVAIRPAAPPTA